MPETEQNDKNINVRVLFNLLLLINTTAISNTLTHYFRVPSQGKYEK